MPESFAVELVAVVKELTRRLKAHDDKENWNYVDYLDSMDVMREVMREEKELPKVWDEIREGTAPDWLQAYGNTITAAARLRTFALGIRTIGGAWGFELKQMIEHWSKLEPDVQLALSWLARRCRLLHEEAQQLRSQVELAASDSNLKKRSMDGGSNS